MNYQASDVRGDFRKFFPDGLTSDQIRVFDKMIRHSRLRCRNNTAYVNYMNSCNLGHKFTLVDGFNETTQKAFKSVRIKEDESRTS